MKGKRPLVESRVDTKLVLMALWIALMFLYLYCDWYSLYRPGYIAEMSSGRIGFFGVSQASLFWLSLLMVIPTVMIIVSALAKARAGRAINMAASAAYFLVNIGNLIGEVWAYYYLFGLLETGLAVFIFIVALRWPRRDE